VSHGRYVALQMAEVAIPRQMFQEILRFIAELGRSRHLRQHETFDVHEFKGNRTGRVRPIAWKNGQIRLLDRRPGA
jgi:hypothetical protein